MRAQSAMCPVSIQCSKPTQVVNKERGGTTEEEEATEGHVLYQGEFSFGDVNDDSTINIADAVYLINYLFIAGLPPFPWLNGDVNCDCKINISDVVYLINYLFVGGPPPCGT